MALGKGDKHVLRLVQWIDPYNPDPPYPPPINHVGIHRVALLVPDLDRAVNILKGRGATFFSEIAPCCSGTDDETSGIVHVIDPDGNFLERVGPIAKQPLQPPPEGCPPLPIKMPPKEEAPVQSATRRSRRTCSFADSQRRQPECSDAAVDLV